jgi:hypothetical protein
MTQPTVGILPKPLGSFQPRPTAQIAASAIGVGFETLDRFMFDPNPVYPRLAQLGAKHARVQTGWCRCETTKGLYDFAWLDDVVDKLLAAGVQPFFSVSYGNQLYMNVPHVSAVGCVPLYYGDEAKAAWLRYVRALAAHFQSRITHWEIWNEPNIAPFWSPREPNPQDYAELVRLTAGPIRDVIPQAKIIGISTCGIAPRFMEDALAAGLADSIDIAAFHPYQAVPETNLQNMHDAIRRLLDRFSPHKRIPIWQGENGCPSDPASHEVFPLYHIDETIQAKWVARRALIDRKIGFDRSFYFHITDLVDVPYRQSDGKPGKPILMGLLRGKTYEPKPAFHVLQRICSLFDDDTKRAELFCHFFHPEPQKPAQSGILSAPIAATFIRNRAPLFAYWLSEDPQQELPATTIELATWWDSSLNFTSTVLLDLLTGHYHDAAPLATPFKGGLRFRLPLTDYPLVLTDASVLTSKA